MGDREGRDAAVVAPTRAGVEVRILGERGVPLSGLGCRWGGASSLSPGLECRWGRGGASSLLPGQELASLGEGPLDGFHLAEGCA